MYTKYQAIFESSWVSQTSLLFHPPNSCSTLVQINKDRLGPSSLSSCCPLLLYLIISSQLSFFNCTVAKYTYHISSFKLILMQNSMYFRKISYFSYSCPLLLILYILWRRNCPPPLWVTEEGGGDTPVSASVVNSLHSPTWGTALSPHE